LKKHSNRPALRAIDVVRWIDKGILQVQRVKRTPILFLTRGWTVRQTWFYRTFRRQLIRKKTATTYLRKGIFLVPIWQLVPAWEVDYYTSRGFPLSDCWISNFDDKDHRLAFMQVEDLDHALRLHDHILDKYLDVKFLRARLPELMRILDTQEQIIQKVVQRSVGTTSFRKEIETTLRSFRRSLSSILNNAPVFNGNFSDETKKPVVSFLRSVIRECQRHPFRPIGRRLLYAVKSLNLAIVYLESGSPRRARERIKSALKNLTYPEEKPKTEP